MIFKLTSRLAGKFFTLASFENQDEAIAAMKKHIDHKLKEDEIEDGEEFSIVYGEYDFVGEEDEKPAFFVMGEFSFTNNGEMK